MPRNKELSDRLLKQIVQYDNNGDGYKKIAKRLCVYPSAVHQIVYKWRALRTTATLSRYGRTSKFYSRNVRKIRREVTNTPRVSSKDVQESLRVAGVDVHQTTIRRALNNIGFHGRVARRKPLLSKKHRQMRLEFPGKINQRHFGSKFFRHMRQKSNYLAITTLVTFGVRRMQLFRKRTWYRRSSTRQRHDLGMICCIWDGETRYRGRRMNSVQYQEILDSNVAPSVRQLGFDPICVFQQDNDPKIRASRLFLALGKQVPVLCFRVAKPEPRLDLNLLEML